MPTPEKHQYQANHNIEFLETFIFHNAHDWAITVMFYAVVHLFDMLIYKEVLKKRDENPEQWDNTLELDPQTHEARGRCIKDLFGREVHIHYDALKKTCRKNRYKIYKTRIDELTNTYIEDFKPLFNFFHEYCTKNNNQIEISIQGLEDKLSQLESM